MTETKRKAMINASVSDLEEIERIVRSGRYRTLSEFVREAVKEKLERLRLAELETAVGRYCEAGHANDDVDWVDLQFSRGKDKGREGRERAPR